MGVAVEAVTEPLVAIAIAVVGKSRSVKEHPVAQTIAALRVATPVKKGEMVVTVAMDKMAEMDN